MELSSSQQSSIDHPVISLLATLFTRVAVPCILLSTVSGIMQVWFGLAKLGDPYPLYSVSNIGSMVALISYPTLIEPNFTVPRTLSFWSMAYFTMALGIAACAAVVWAKMRGTNYQATTLSWKDTALVSPRVSSKQFLLWMFFSAMGSATLLSYSSYITSDIAPAPLLWVIPLAVYLLTFILVFANMRFYRKRLLLSTWPWLFACEPICLTLMPVLSIIVNLLIIFQLCMICHGELVASKPSVADLPAFYLAIASGGVLGGAFVSIIAPLLFNFDAERFIIVGIMALFTVNELVIKQLKVPKKRGLLYVLATCCMLFMYFFLLKLTSSNIIYRERNFYGSAMVSMQDNCLVLSHGRVNHGQQYLDPAKVDLPAGHYYGLPLKLITNFLHSRCCGNSLSTGAVGLGVGTLAVYGKPFDTITFYELDPKIIRITQRYFSYLSRSKATIKIKTGDGRAVLKSLPPQNYDLLLIDAFNGDAIPCHLLTIQAIDIYLKHLKEDGLLLFHVTNGFVDLSPVLANLAKQLNLQAYNISLSNKEAAYVVLCRDKNQLSLLLRFAQDHSVDYPGVEISKTIVRPNVGVWTDDFSNLIGVLKL